MKCGVTGSHDYWPITEERIVSEGLASSANVSAIDVDPSMTSASCLLSEDPHDVSLLSWRTGLFIPHDRSSLEHLLLASSRPCTSVCSAPKYGCKFVTLNSRVVSFWNSYTGETDLIMSRKSIATGQRQKKKKYEWRWLCFATQQSLKRVNHIAQGEC